MNDAKPEVASLPANCRQRLMHEGKAYPRSGCAACGQWMPRAKECEAALAKPASGDGLPAIIADIRHSALVDDYEPQQIAFLESIADRLTTEQPGAKVRIPTETMEQEFASHYQRGYAAAKAEQPGSSVQGEADEAAMEAWHSAVEEAGELYVNAPDSRYANRARRVKAWIVSHRPTPPPAPAAEQGDTFQRGVEAWMGECFPPGIVHDRTERGDRLLEEVLELLQSHSYDRNRVATLVDYVYGRPVGEPAQEVGGVMVTLAAYCMVTGLNMHDEGDRELARIMQPEVMAKIRRKQEAKNALHFDTPLPGNAATPPEARGVEGMVYGSIAHRLYCEIVCNGDPECFNALDIATQRRWVGGVEKVLAATPNPVRAEQPEGKWAWKRVPVPEAVPMSKDGLLVGSVVQPTDWIISTDCSARVVDERMAYGWNECRKAMLAAAPAAPGVRVDRARIEAARNNIATMVKQVPDEWADAMVELRDDLTAALAPDGGEGE